MKRKQQEALLPDAAFDQATLTMLLKEIDRSINKQAALATESKKKVIRLKRLRTDLRALKPKETPPGL